MAERDLVAKAEAFARQAHAGQVDKQGRDYADHHLAPVAALLRPFGPEAEAAGWLHDVIEDCGVTWGTLCKETGATVAVVDAVDSVTRRPWEPYETLIRRAADDQLGRYVKLMDNWVNLTGLDDLARVDPEKAASLRKRYEAARVVLLKACGLEGEV